MILGHATFGLIYLQLGTNEGPFLIVSLWGLGITAPSIVAVYSYRQVLLQLFQDNWIVGPVGLIAYWGQLWLCANDVLFHPQFALIPYSYFGVLAILVFYWMVAALLALGWLVQSLRGKFQTRRIRVLGLLSSWIVLIAAIYNMIFSVPDFPWKTVPGIVHMLAVGFVLVMLPTWEKES